MMGNVWEWMESPFTSGDYGAGSSRGMRGAGWIYSSSYLAVSYRGNWNPADVDTFMGFRVASVPEPGSMAMLAGLAVGALLY
jgi:formylglycine-generating enzyme required for sulfatase activity